MSEVELLKSLKKRSRKPRTPLSDFEIIEQRELIDSTFKILEKDRGGRPKLENQKKVTSFRLSLEHRQVIALAPGDNDTEKLSWILENFYFLKTKREKELLKLEDLVFASYKYMRVFFSGDISKEKRRKAREQFLGSYDNLKSLINLLHIDFIDYDIFLDSDLKTKLNLVLSSRDSIAGERL